MATQEVDGLKTKTNSYGNNHKAYLAQAGLDLFLSSFVFDAKTPCNVEARHPAVSPNLESISENSVLDHDGNINSQVIVLMSEKIEGNGIFISGESLKERIDLVTCLYQSSINGKNKQAHYYVVPISYVEHESPMDDLEIIRRDLIASGIPNHHIIMDCVMVNITENFVKLAGILNHLHIANIHVVTSKSLVSSTQKYFEILYKELNGSELKIKYHTTDVSPDVSYKNIESSCIGS